MSTIPVSNVVNVTIQTGPQFPQRRGFGLVNIIGVSDVIPLAERIRYYSNIEGVAADFDSADPEYQAALSAFSQNPRPRELAISRRDPANAIQDELDEIQGCNRDWYFFGFTDELHDQNAEILDAAEWAEAQVKIFMNLTNTADALDATLETDIGYLLKNAGYRRSFTLYDPDDNAAHFSAAARASTVNFNIPDSTITLKFKQLPGVTPSVITESQRQALIGKNINYYAEFGKSRMLAESTMAQDGVFIDEVHGVDWLQNAIETNVFGYLYTHPTKVPQTDKGVAALEQQVRLALQEAVRNGLIAPGTNSLTGEFMEKGFVTWAQPVAEQNQSDREARKAPPIYFLAKGAGAIHSVDIQGVFQR